MGNLIICHCFHVVDYYKIERGSIERYSEVMILGYNEMIVTHG